jgi:hypothetical protein
MPTYPTKILTVIQSKEAEIKAKFGAPFYDRLVAGDASIREFITVQQFLRTLG